MLHGLPASQDRQALRCAAANVAQRRKHLNMRDEMGGKLGKAGTHGPDEAGAPGVKAAGRSDGCADGVIPEARVDRPGGLRGAIE